MGLGSPSRKHTGEGEVILHVIVLPALTGSEFQTAAS
jgi:hypothetical protein